MKSKEQEAIIRAQVGKRLSYYRNIRGYSQEALAEETDLSPSTIRKIESGERLPSTIAMLSICRVLGIGPNLLYQDSLDFLPVLHEETMLAELVNKGSASDRAYFETMLKEFYKMREILQKECIELYLKNK